MHGAKPVATLLSTSTNLHPIGGTTLTNPTAYRSLVGVFYIERRTERVEVGFGSGGDEEYSTMAEQIESLPDGKRGNQFYNNVGLGFKTPKEAIEVCSSTIVISSVMCLVIRRLCR
ncbi:hypothetical protein MKW98_004864 [Papaver atlanticum]|uniref:Uncharacterized protein n=1 Tax=Papaver atlanticum TaxID=357466 RepID=A0AAD4RWV7_9MAGN|nr:hypothetical protein MKW98_004864 [Papaver atlanticum]